MALMILEKLTILLTWSALVILSRCHWNISRIIAVSRTLCNFPMMPLEDLQYLSASLCNSTIMPLEHPPYHTASHGNSPTMPLERPPNGMPLISRFEIRDELSPVLFI